MYIATAYTAQHVHVAFIIVHKYDAAYAVLFLSTNNRIYALMTRDWG